jgi:hypothetical protein
MLSRFALCQGSEITKSGARGNAGAGPEKFSAGPLKAFCGGERMLRAMRFHIFPLALKDRLPTASP